MKKRVLNMKRVLIGTMLCLMFQANVLAEDPCSAAADKFVCINAEIAALKSEIQLRVEYLSTTQGEKGDEGDAGPKGATGPKGEVGYDRFSVFKENLLARHDSLEAKTTALLTDILDIDDAIGGGALQMSFAGVQRKYGDINRNPDIIGTGSGQLPFPHGDNGVDLAQFSIINGNAFCLYSNPDNILHENCAGTYVGGFEIIVVCDPDCPEEETYNGVTASSFELIEPPCDAGIYGLSYCSNTFDSDTIIEITNVEATFSDGAEIDLPPGSCVTDSSGNEVCGAEAPVEILSANEYASYKMGFRPGDPLYVKALDNILDRLNDDQFLAEVLTSVDEAKAGVDAQIIVLNVIDPAAAAELIAQKPDIIAGLDRSKNLINAIASASRANARIQLSELAVDSDMIYFMLVDSMIEIYSDYRTCFVGQFLPQFSGVCTRTFTDEETEAIEAFDAYMLAYMKDYLRRWQNTAYEMREDFLSEITGVTLAALLSAPTTPDFVELAQAQLNEEYLEGQVGVLKSWHGALAGAGVTGATWALGAAAAFTATSLTTTAGTAVSFGGIAAGGLVSGGGSTALSAVSSLAVSTGPVAIITIALVIGVLEAVEVFNQAAIDKKYDALIELDVDSINNTFAFDRTQMANLVYMALMIDGPKSVANSSNW